MAWMRLPNARARAEGEASFVLSLQEPTFNACMKNKPTKGNQRQQPESKEIREK